MKAVFVENSPHFSAHKEHAHSKKTCCENIEPKKVRIRYKIPTYKKCDKINSNIKDYQGNQPHVFRYRTLYAIYEKTARTILHGQLKLKFGELRLFYDGLVFHLNCEEPCLAEVEGTELLPVGERIRIHIRLLRLLKKGEKVRKAVKAAGYGKINPVDNNKS